MSLPLSRVQVIDLTTVRSGPTCTKVLADFGAEVLRVERPGESARDRALFDAADLHRNKKSLVLDLQHPKGVEILKRIVARADVVVENYRPDVTLSRRPVAEWVEILNAAGVACGPIYTLDQVFADPQVARFNLVHALQHPVWGLVKVLTMPVHLSRTPSQARTPAPLPGQHTREVLEGVGYDRATIDGLLTDGVIEEARRGNP